MPRSKAKKSKQHSNGVGKEALLKWHRLHAGLYRRVAESLRVDASYVSRVANGQRNAPEIKSALLGELARLRKMIPSDRA